MTGSVISADLMLRTADDLVLTTADATDEPLDVGAQVLVVNLRDGVQHVGHVAGRDDSVGHVFLSIDDEPSRLERFRNRRALLELILSAQRAAREAYDTGDREQSNTCIRDHLSEVQLELLRQADRYTCPTCGHLLKDRDGHV